MPGTRIVVLRRKHVVYFAVVAVIIVVAIVAAVLGVSEKVKKGNSMSAKMGNARYQAGVYTKDMMFGESMVSLQISLDTDHVKAVEIVPLEESIATMYPLMEPAVKTISEQLAAGVAPEDIAYDEEGRYTQETIMEVVEQVLTENANERDK